MEDSRLQHKIYDSIETVSDEEPVAEDSIFLPPCRKQFDIYRGPETDARNTLQVRMGDTQVRILGEEDKMLHRNYSNSSFNFYAVDNHIISKRGEIGIGDNYI